MINAKNPLEEGETDIPSVKEEGSAKLQQERVQEAQAKFIEKIPLGIFLAKAQNAKEA